MSASNHKRLIALIVHHPWKTLALLGCLFVFLAQYIVQVQPSVSYQDLLGPTHPKLLDYEALQREYTRDENLLVLFEAKDGDAFDQATLDAMQALTAQLWHTPYAIRVDSLTNFQHSYAVGDELIVSDLYLTDPDAADTALRSPTEVRDISQREPLLMNRATNAEGNVLAASVSFAFPNHDAQEKLDAYAYVMALREQLLAQHPQLNVYVSGLIALDATVMQISQQETGLFLLLVTGVVMVLLAVFMRTLIPVLLSIGVCLCSIVMALSLAGLMGWKLTPFSAAVPLMILIIAVADCVHMVTAYVHQLGRVHEKRQALTLALDSNLGPVTITSLTTAVGFLTLNFSESEAIHALGNEVAFGVMAACIFSLTLLPAALAIAPAPRGRAASKGQQTRWSDAVTGFVTRRRRAILWVSLGIGITLCISITRNEINDIIPHYFSDSLPWRQANDFAEREFGGAYTFSWSLQARHSNGISDPAFLAKAEQFVDWLRAQPSVVYVNSVTDTLKRLNRNMHADDAAYYQLPSNPALAAQYLLLYEMSLPFGLDLNDQVNLDKTALRIRATFTTLSTQQILAMEVEVAEWLDTHLPEVDVTGSGVQLMLAHMLNKDVINLLLGTTLGLAVISLLLILAFRSWRIGLISLAPNLVPAMLAFGIWGLTVGQIGMGLAMVSGMTVGIIVDDTVHFLYKYLTARRQQGLSAADAIAYTYKTVGPAIVFTTTVLISGFVLMAFIAQFRVNSDMATMTSIVLALALIFDLITLPAVLLTLDRKHHRHAADAAPQHA